MTKTPSLRARLWSNPLMRGFLVFSAFRAVYGIGILVVTYLLVTNESAPWWTSLLFLMASMVLSRIIFRSIKRTWPSLFETETTTDVAGVNESNQTTP